MIPPSLFEVAVHPLLYHDPLAIIGDNETVEVQVEAILDRSRVDLGNEPAGFCECKAIKADPISNGDKLVRCLF